MCLFHPACASGLKVPLQMARQGLPRKPPSVQTSGRRWHVTIHPSHTSVEAGGPSTLFSEHLFCPLLGKPGAGWEVQRWLWRETRSGLNPQCEGTRGHLIIFSIFIYFSASGLSCSTRGPRLVVACGI